VRASKKGAMTEAEAERLRRIAEILRWGSIAVALTMLPAVAVTWYEQGRILGIGLSVCVVLIFLDGAFFLPWIFERVIEKRGVTEP
jgi:hypothetical protein